MRDILDIRRSLVLMDNQFPVAGEVDITFYRISPLVNGAFKGGKGAFRSLLRIATMGHDGWFHYFLTLPVSIFLCISFFQWNIMAR